jgi:hypothetical protein
VDFSANARAHVYFARPGRRQTKAWPSRDRRSTR